MDLNLKIKHLLTQTRVMTLGVCENDFPWSAPVYFLYENNVFFFFSNPGSNHVQYARGDKKSSASIFHDADNLADIFGIQMSGRIRKIPAGIRYIQIVKMYVNKFNFLSQVFGSHMVENPDFFMEKFKSDLYGFYPEAIFLSDNSRSENKRVSIEIHGI